MSMVSALARAQAMESMTAVPVTAYRHRNLSDRPLVVIPLTMAGEVGAPLAAMVGTSKKDATLLVVEQPRNRDQRFAFAAALGDLVMEYIDSFRQDRRGEGEKSRYSGAPQLLVPNTGGIKALADLGRMCRYRSTTGPYAVADVVPEFGMWLTFLVERAEQAGTCLLLPVTGMLAEHWATGQSTLEDQNLASLMAWISPPPGTDVAQALADAESPDICPPAGPTTSPQFDNRVLAPAIKRFDTANQAANPAALAAARAELRELIAEQIQPTWRTVWEAVPLLRSVPEAPRTAARFGRDCAAFTSYSDYRDAGGLPQPKRDTAIGAARRLDRLEQALVDFESDMAFDDPFVLADRRSVGEAFAGTVVACEPGRVVLSRSNRRVLRPLVTIRTDDPVRLAAGTKLVSPQMPAGHKAEIVSVLPDGGTMLVTVEVTGGMGTIRTPKADGVPVLDRHIAYLPDPGWRPGAQFPAPDSIPWTHRSPAQAPDADTTEAETDAAEGWGHDD
ncbi:hypothetical protein ACFVYP_35965 [Kitasatospora sp. NPDC058201]|uniref:hypothetical protein n=1 Tax=unclassified Kitasatospora TaxID=2633591 RepID=UPI003669BB28